MKKKWLLLIFVVPSLLFSQIGMGVKINNNHWDDHWVYSLSPEFEIMSGPILWMFDGTWGYYHPDGHEKYTVFTARASLLPALATRWKLFTIGCGYGVCYQFRRENLVGQSDGESVHETEGFHGEAMLLAGISFKITDEVTVMLRGEYHYVESAHEYFNTAAVFQFSRSADKKNEKLTEPIVPESIRESTKPAEEQTSPVVFTPKLPKLGIIHHADPVVSEFNAFMESGLIHSGFEVYNWANIRQAALDSLHESKKENPEKLLFTMTDMDIAVLGGHQCIC